MKSKKTNLLIISGLVLFVLILVYFGSISRSKSETVLFCVTEFQTCKEYEYGQIQKSNSQANCVVDPESKSNICRPAFQLYRMSTLAPKIDSLCKKMGGVYKPPLTCVTGGPTLKFNTFKEDWDKQS